MLNSKKGIFGRTRSFCLIPKNFGPFAQFLERRTASECIKNYYLTKKKTKYNNLAHLFKYTGQGYFKNYRGMFWTIRKNIFLKIFLLHPKNFCQIVQFQRGRQHLRASSTIITWQSRIQTARSWFILYITAHKDTSWIKEACLDEEEKNIFLKIFCFI